MQALAGAMAGHLSQLGGRHCSEVTSLSAQESVSEGGDSYFVPQEKLKPEYLKTLPDKMKLISQFLGKRSWFAGDKVRGRFGGGGDDIFPGSELGIIHPLPLCSSPTWISWLMTS